MKTNEIAKRGGTKVFTTEYASITEVVNHVGAAERNKKVWVSESDQSSDTGDKSFTMTKNYGEALHLLKNGWEEGSKKLTHKLKISNKRDTETVKRAVYDVVGFQASVPRYLQGIPTNMVNKRSVKQKAKVVTLVKSIAYHGGVSANQILEDSTKFIQIIQEIEKQGVRVNVHVALFSSCGREQLAIRIPVKKASERLNISKMSFPLLHPSFLRRIMFRAFEVDQRLTNSSWKYGYGRPGDEYQFKTILAKNEYFIPVLINEYQAANIINNVQESKK